MFSTAFPLAGVLALTNNLFELPGDIQHFTQSRRVVSGGCPGIGMWAHLIDMLGLCAVLTNCIIIYNTCSSLQGFAESALGQSEYHAMCPMEAGFVKYAAASATLSVSSTESAVQDAMSAGASMCGISVFKVVLLVSLSAFTLTLTLRKLAHIFYNIIVLFTLQLLSTSTLVVLSSREK